MMGCLRSVWRRGRGAATPPAIGDVWIEQDARELRRGYLSETRRAVADRGPPWSRLTARLHESASPFRGGWRPRIRRCTDFTYPTTCAVLGRGEVRDRDRPARGRLPVVQGMTHHPSLGQRAMESEADRPRLREPAVAAEPDRDAGAGHLLRARTATDRTGRPALVRRHAPRPGVWSRHLHAPLRAAGGPGVGRGARSLAGDATPCSAPRPRGWDRERPAGSRRRHAPAVRQRQIRRRELLRRAPPVPGSRPGAARGASRAEAGAGASPWPPSGEDPVGSRPSAPRSADASWASTRSRRRTCRHASTPSGWARSRATTPARNG